MNQSAGGRYTLLVIAEDDQPGVVVLDHWLSGELTGLEAARMIKAAPNAKILLFTAFDLEQQAANEPAVDAYPRKDRVAKLLDRPACHQASDREPECCLPKGLPT